MYDPLNISVVGGNWFCSMVTVGNHFPRIVFSLVIQKVSGGQEQEQVFVAMEFTVQIILFVELRPRTQTIFNQNILCPGNNYYKINIGSHKGLSAIFKILYSNPCGYLLIL